MIDIVHNYIGVVKGLLEESGVFEEVPKVSWEDAYASSKYLLEHQSVNGLVGVLMCIQENSKEAFSQGGVEVHRVYIRMSELLKEIYLSYEHENWLFPPDILLYIPLRYFIEISDDIRADVKKTLFQMVNVLNEDRLPYRLVHRNGKPQRERVDRAEYLQVILYFLEECKREEEYINLPEIVPTNMETSILYVKSLESKLNMKEPNEDQKPYFKNMLDFCQNYKLTINFKWYDCPESAEDR
jgi:hypothetical protein